MNTGEYRQIALPGFDTIGAMQDFFVSKEHDESEAETPYTLSTNNFVGAISRIDTVNFRESALYHAQVYFQSENVDGTEKTIIHLTMGTGRQHEEQAESLAHEAVHIDRGPAPFGPCPVPDELGKISLKELRELHPEIFEQYMEYINVTRDIKNAEEEIVDKAAETFYASHPSLARVALCHVWGRYEFGS